MNFVPGVLYRQVSDVRVVFCRTSDNESTWLLREWPVAAKQFFHRRHPLRQAQGTSGHEGAQRCCSTPPDSTPPRHISRVWLRLSGGPRLLPPPALSSRGCFHVLPETGIRAPGFLHTCIGYVSEPSVLSYLVKVA